VNSGSSESQVKKPPVLPTPLPTPLPTTRIVGVRVAAAHDGEAELIVTVGYENGGTSEIALDQMASASLMESCGAQTIEELEGQSWKKVREALLTSYNRFQN
jgi:hypothetical protein